VGASRPSPGPADSAPGLRRADMQCHRDCRGCVRGVGPEPQGRREVAGPGDPGQRRWRSRIDALVAGLPRQAWKRLSCGPGAYRLRAYDWTRVAIRVWMGERLRPSAPVGPWAPPGLTGREPSTCRKTAQKSSRGRFPAIRRRSRAPLAYFCHAPTER
jgi:hypothetical protein